MSACIRFRPAVGSSCTTAQVVVLKSLISNYHMGNLQILSAHDVPVNFCLIYSPDVYTVPLHRIKLGRGSSKSRIPVQPSKA
jgi:hypothetical protein